MIFMHLTIKVFLSDVFLFLFVLSPCFMPLIHILNNFTILITFKYFHLMIYYVRFFYEWIWNLIRTKRHLVIWIWKYEFTTWTECGWHHDAIKSLLCFSLCDEFLQGLFMSIVLIGMFVVFIKYSFVSFLDIILN